MFQLFHLIDNFADLKLRDGKHFEATTIFILRNSNLIFRPPEFSSSTQLRRLLQPRFDTNFHASGSPLQREEKFPYPWKEIMWVYRRVRASSRRKE